MWKDDDQFHYRIIISHGNHWRKAKLKRMMVFISTTILTLTLVACDGNDGGNTSSDEPNDENMTEKSNQENDDTNATDDEGQNSETDSNDMKAKMDELDYSDFELEVDYDPDQEYEAEIEQKEGNVKADLEDEINGEDLNGQEAFDKIYPLVEQLTISKDTEKEDAIAEVLEVFDLDDDYSKLELEITFSDGVKMEFEDRK